MKSNTFPTRLRAALVLFTMALFVTTNLAATEKVLHNFGSGMDGVSPWASLIFDAAGNLYGTTSKGGDYTCEGYGCGTVFEMTPREGGGWTEKVLHNFGHGMDGYWPQAGLIMDAAGNLYGTSQSGGVYGYGTVFELSRGEDGWKEKVLHNFGSGKDGGWPSAPLIFDAAGNLYGTANTRGVYGVGTVFEMTPKEGGGWTEKTLHHFGLYPTDGQYPVAGLIFDAAGNLYGTSQSGGVYGVGTVFEMMPREGGGWTEQVLHSFNGTDGARPYAGLIIDAAGNLYGTSQGDYGDGTVFEMTPKEAGGWTEKTLYGFGNRMEGSYPQAGLIMDAAGNLYGTTATGGAGQCVWGGVFGCGTVFELTPEQGGGWAWKKLHNFGINGNDGAYPQADLIFDAAGNLYGTTCSGGDHSCGVDYGCGTVFEITPD